MFPALKSTAKGQPISMLVNYLHLQNRGTLHPSCVKIRHDLIAKHRQELSGGEDKEEGAQFTPGNVVKLYSPVRLLSSAGPGPAGNRCSLQDPKADSAGTEDSASCWVGKKRAKSGLFAS